MMMNDLPPRAISEPGIVIQRNMDRPPATFSQLTLSVWPRPVQTAEPLPALPPRKPNRNRPLEQMGSL